MKTLIPAGSFWKTDYGIEPKGGLVLQNVSNDLFSLAKDMRVTAMWIGSHDPAAASKPATAVLKKLNLASGELKATSPAAEIAASALAAPANFICYVPEAGLRAEYQTPNTVLGGDQLSVTQEFLFCPYGLNPPHEPGAVLRAARLFPLVSFKTDTIASGDKIRYIRIDYRFEFDLDAEIDGAEPIDSLLHKPHARTGNHAAIFRDTEDVPFPIQPRASSPRLANLSDVFAAAEKPLQYEVTALGISHGQSLVNKRPVTWDNYHHFPMGEPLPSTPGAFHCAHLHWRWGAITGGAPMMLLPSAGDPQFGQRKLNGWAPGGPLLDPRIPDQTLRFAVTDASTPTHQAVLNPSEQKFEDLFVKKALPGRIPPEGSALVTWFSIEVFRDPKDDRDSWEGTVFIHGLYFAHNPEPPLLSVSGATAMLGGLRDGLLKPKPTQKWVRNAI